MSFLLYMLGVAFNNIRPGDCTLRIGKDTILVANVECYKSFKPRVVEGYWYLGTEQSIFVEGKYPPKDEEKIADTGTRVVYFDEPLPGIRKARSGNGARIFRVRLLARYAKMKSLHGRGSITPSSLFLVTVLSYRRVR